MATPGADLAWKKTTSRGVRARTTRGQMILLKVFMPLAGA